MMPIDIIQKLLFEEWYQVNNRYCEYTEKVGVLTLMKDKNYVTFRCAYDTVEQMEQDMDGLTAALKQRF